MSQEPLYSVGEMMEIYMQFANGYFHISLQIDTGWYSCTWHEYKKESG